MIPSTQAELNAELVISLKSMLQPPANVSTCLCTSGGGGFARGRFVLDSNERAAIYNDDRENPVIHSDVICVWNYWYVGFSGISLFTETYQSGIAAA